MPGTNRLTPLLALLFVLAALSGCGSSDGDGTIPSQNAGNLIAQLDAVRAAVDRGECEAAQASADQFVAEVDLLPSSTGESVKDALRDAGTNLERLAADPSQCQTTTTADTTTQPTTPTDETTSTTDETATTTDETTTTTDETTTTTDEQPPPGNGNGGGPPGGGTDGGTGGTGGGTGDKSDE